MRRPSNASCSRSPFKMAASVVAAVAGGTASAAQARKASALDNLQNRIVTNEWHPYDDMHNASMGTLFAGDLHVERFDMKTP